MNFQLDCPERYARLVMLVSRYCSSLDYDETNLIIYRIAVASGCLDISLPFSDRQRDLTLKWVNDNFPEIYCSLAKGH